jgi:hypothetical protein
MMDLAHREELMIAELKKSVPFATGLKSQVEHVLVKRLRLREIVNFDRNMVAAIDLNIHPLIIALISLGIERRQVDGSPWDPAPQSHSLDRKQAIRWSICSRGKNDRRRPDASRTRWPLLWITASTRTRETCYALIEQDI